jgi:hypothetical protein
MFRIAALMAAGCFTAAPAGAAEVITFINSNVQVNPAVAIQTPIVDAAYAVALDEVEDFAQTPDFTMQDISAHLHLATSLQAPDDTVGEIATDETIAATFTSPASGQFALDLTGAATNYAEDVRSMGLFYYHGVYNFSVSRFSSISFDVADGGFGTLRLFSQSESVNLFNEAITTGSFTRLMKAGDYSLFIEGTHAPLLLNDEPGTVTVEKHTTVDFDIAGAAPEPATWAMLLLGFAGAGAALRRRQKQATFSTR